MGSSGRVDEAAIAAADIEVDAVGGNVVYGHPKGAISATQRGVQKSRSQSPRTLTVIVPVRNGASELDRCIASLAAQSFLRRGELRVVVVCNACTDNTVDVAEGWKPYMVRLGAEMVCLDLRQAGRANAFNIGEARIGAVPGPRVYLDSNAYVSPTALDDLVEVLAPDTGIGFVALRVETSPPRSSVTRAYAQLWPSLPYVHGRCATMGMYAVSEEGRKRWGEFPTIHSDDKWVRLHFAPSERSVVTSSSYTVALPEGVRELYRARLRYERGNRELRELYPELLMNESWRYEGLLRVVSRFPRRWIPVAGLSAIQGAALIRARSQRFSMS